ncbi:tetratricopeptide repeat protein [Helicobacter sp. 11S02629-2]|uniref:tetratricopeptide repeat protein n=1 Tax=Helicobacter sp. 11S02629-2 TaxID=1476195 RepID=UPI000BA77A2B|nr:tetratricopeptide repeat protein [Helicobacter sp. 11S02629-2]PAF44610.1 hypothetical protein BKH40_05100 [Helicobacter sp. 11S02629-2]
MKKGILLGALLIAGFAYANPTSLNDFFSPSHLQNTEHFTNPNRDDEIRYYKRNCDNNNALACNSLANLYFSGSGIAQDYQTASKLYAKACELGSANACTSLASIYKNGISGKKDSMLAKSYYQKACNLGDNTSCLESK